MTISKLDPQNTRCFVFLCEKVKNIKIFALAQMTALSIHEVLSLPHGRGGRGYKEKSEIKRQERESLHALAKSLLDRVTAAAAW